MDKLKKEQVETRRATAGNSKSQPLQYRYWCFTLNNYTIEQIEQIEQLLLNECEWFVFQEEIGKLTRTPHIQGTMKLKQRQRLNQLKKIDNTIHWEPTKQITASIAYCSKTETRNGKQWVYGIEIPKPKKPIILWAKWQFEIEKICETEPDDRTVHWYWDAKGKSGKTTLCRYLTRKFGAVQLEGQKKDILFCAATYESNIYLYDLERPMEDFVSYASIEKIKNGYYMCAKYKSRPVDRDPPHVFIFANFPPDSTKLSEDRWHIVNIKPE